MALLQSTYKPPFWLKNAHLSTLYPNYVRRVKATYDRERLELPDGDFVDLDWLKSGARRAVVLVHGLAGDSVRPYVVGMANRLARSGWDVIALNLRGCSGTPNRLVRFHSGTDSGDLRAVVNLLRKRGYPEIQLVGFSLGGSIVLRYLGEAGTEAPPEVKGAVAISVPCDLGACVEHLSKGFQKNYTKFFIKIFKKKLIQKEAAMPGTIDLAPLDDIKTIREFDEIYSTKWYDLPSADAYYEACSCRRFLAPIRVPTLLINAANDPFFAKVCHPVEEAREHPYFDLELAQYGGHVGFWSTGKGKPVWSEWRAELFLEKGKVNASAFP